MGSGGGRVRGRRAPVFWCRGRPGLPRGQRGHVERPRHHRRVACPGRGDQHAGGRDREPGRGALRWLGAGIAGGWKRLAAAVGAASTGAVGGQRGDQDRLGAPDGVGGAALARAGLSEVHRVAVEPHAHRRIGRQVVDRPGLRDHEPVAVVADHLRRRLGGRGAGGDRRSRRRAGARGEQQRKERDRGEFESGSESEQSTHPHITRRAGPHPVDRILLADERATWSGHANEVRSSLQSELRRFSAPVARPRSGDHPLDDRVRDPEDVVAHPVEHQVDERLGR